jgi:hypothetical protein
LAFCAIGMAGKFACEGTEFHGQLELGRRGPDARAAIAPRSANLCRCRRDKSNRADDPGLGNAMINANAIAIAGGAIAASLVDVLTDKGLLTEDEAASVRAKALQLLTPYTMTSRDADAACRFITDMLIGLPRVRGK